MAYLKLITHTDPKTVAASMLRQGIEGISPRKFTPVTTIQGVDTYHLCRDRVRRQWNQGTLDKVWTSDITYLRINEGWLYLCAVRDGCSRRALDSVQNTDLVERALRMARTLRQDQIPGQVGCSTPDRGSQFTSAQLHEVAVELDLYLQSVGRTGVCWDNAMSESFWSTLKTEFYDRYRWATSEDAKQKVAWWIERFL